MCFFFFIGREIDDRGVKEGNQIHASEHFRGDLKSDTLEYVGTNLLTVLVAFSNFF